MAHTPAVLTPFRRSGVFSKYLGVNIRLYHLAIIRVFRPLGGCRRLRYFWYVRISHRYIDLSLCNHVQGRCGKGAANCDSETGRNQYAPLWLSTAPTVRNSSTMSPIIDQFCT